MRTLQLGISDFKEFIDENCYFVDKTPLIGYLINNPDKVHLITRPRRFGKTLNLSMIRYFLEAPLPPHSGNPLFAIENTSSPPPETLHLNTPPSGQSKTQNSELKTPHAYLFEELAITSHPRCAEFMGQYPVIHLSFKNAKNNSYTKTINLVKELIAIEFDRHGYLAEQGLLNSREKVFFTDIVNQEGTDEDYAKSIKWLSAWLHRAYGKAPYILLDEYDTPLHAAHVDRYYDEMIAFIRSFMVQTFKDNPHLKQAVLIGILKIAQESIFSDFNNPRVSTILSPAMKDCFGFTEAELEKMASYFGMESKMDGIKEWYNGYIFGGDTVIYNPWSIVNYLSSPDEGLKPHWINTSDNRLVKEVIKLKRRDAKMTTEKLLRKEEVRKPLLTNIPYTQVENDPDVVWSFLLHSGYLKASEMQQEELGTSWQLSIPNKEVETAWKTVVLNWLKEDLSVNEDFTDFVCGIREANPQLIERGLKRILFGLSSYYDSARDEEERRENFYHGLVLGLLAYLGSAYAVESNREYGRGRSDIVVVRKGSDPAQAEEAFAFEFKQGNSAADTSLEELAQAAYAQAVEGYLEGVREKWHPKELLVLGIGFRGKELSLYCEA